MKWAYSFLYNMFYHIFLEDEREFSPKVLLWATNFYGSPLPIMGVHIIGLFWSTNFSRIVQRVTVVPN